MTRLKLTGVTRVEDAVLAAELGIHVLSCVFYARSPRYVDSSRVWQMRAVLPPTTRLIGVFVDTPAPLVQRVVDQCQLDGAQLFGGESSEELDALDTWVIKAVSVRTRADIAAASGTFLDRRARRSGDPRLLLHLTGEIADRWDLVTDIGERAPIVLASDALSPERIENAITSCRPWALDVWDAVETEPGVIDASKLRDWVAAARAAGALPPVGPIASARDG